MMDSFLIPGPQTMFVCWQGPSKTFTITPFLSINVFQKASSKMFIIENSTVFFFLLMLLKKCSRRFPFPRNILQECVRIHSFRIKPAFHIMILPRQPDNKDCKIIQYIHNQPSLKVHSAPKLQANSRIFFSEGTTFSESAFPPWWLAQNSGASWTWNHSLRMAEDGGDSVATCTFNIHEVRVGALN